MNAIDLTDTEEQSVVRRMSLRLARWHEATLTATGRVPRSAGPEMLYVSLGAPYGFTEKAVERFSSFVAVHGTTPSTCN